MWPAPSRSCVSCNPETIRTASCRQLITQHTACDQCCCQQCRDSVELVKRQQQQQQQHHRKTSKTNKTTLHPRCNCSSLQRSIWVNHWVGIVLRTIPCTQSPLGCSRPIVTGFTTPGRHSWLPFGTALQQWLGKVHTRSWCPTGVKSR